MDFALGSGAICGFRLKAVRADLRESARICRIGLPRLCRGSGLISENLPELVSAVKAFRWRGPQRGVAGGAAPIRPELPIDTATACILRIRQESCAVPGDAEIPHRGASEISPALFSIFSPVSAPRSFRDFACAIFDIFPCVCVRRGASEISLERGASEIPRWGFPDFALRYFQISPVRRASEISPAKFPRFPLRAPARTQPYVDARIRRISP